MPTIRIELFHDPTKPWKLAEASLLFTERDGPLLAGLTLRGFTIGTTKAPGKEVNITVPARTYTRTVTDPATGAINTRRAQYQYLVPTDTAESHRVEILLSQILEAYHNIKALTSDPGDPA